LTPAHGAHAFGRINGGQRRGDQALAERFLNLLHRI